MEKATLAALLRWYDEHKRDLPWRRTRDPYCIWLSEIMLQQTRVEAVKEYYRRFLLLFPTVSRLAAAPEEQVLKAWEGLGYYSRARNLQKAAREIVKQGGAFPASYDALLELPGVGPYTAGAVASIAFDLPVPAVDGNVIRVFSRFFGVREDVGGPLVQRRIRDLAQAALSRERPGDFNQALMELGATVCTPTSPACEECPWRGECDGYAEGDMALLPIHEKKRPQKVVPVSVCLVFYQSAVLVMKRQERMLRGLYVFDLLEGEADRRAAGEMLKRQGLSCAFAESTGMARHVFTHRVWEMEIQRWQLQEAPSPAALAAIEARMVTADELRALPMPTAMKAARETALALLSPA